MDFLFVSLAFTLNERLLKLEWTLVQIIQVVMKMVICIMCYECVTSWKKHVNVYRIIMITKNNILNEESKKKKKKDVSA